MSSLILNYGPLMQLHLEIPPEVEAPYKAGPRTLRAIESDNFPFEQLSRIAERESWRKEIYRPIYHVHKWWAQRLGSVFRGILLGTLTAKGTNVLDLFYAPTRFPDTVVFDPFMGSGTTIGEVLKLGALAIGRDINPVSYLQVHTALTMRGAKDLKKTFEEIEEDVAATISSYYITRLADGSTCQVLYYFWVMYVPCPVCCVRVDLFANYVFAKHAYSRRNPAVHVVCPKCGGLSPEDRQVRQLECSECGHLFNATVGPVRRQAATCPDCLCEFTIAHAIRKTNSPPSYRMYAKLVLTPDGKKEYHRITAYDEALYQKAANDLEDSSYPIPEEVLESGYNTNQALNYGFTSWRHMFNARQLLCISMLADRIKKIEDFWLRDAFTCLFSGALEFNNMFASYKGEGTGAVRHMFYHHILKPERTPLEANIWGTPKSSGAFSTLFRSRLLRAADYAQQPFELALSTEELNIKSIKVDQINDSLIGITNSESYEQFASNSNLYVSCGDSASTDLPDECVDAVVTDPPFFDNVHYSQLADFFFVWQRLILDNYPSHLANTTRSAYEVQNSDANAFTKRLSSVFKESARVLKCNGLLVFTYHHSKWEGWGSVLRAISAAGFRIMACHPVKSEMSVAAPKHQARAPINFDIIIVCRKSDSEIAKAQVAGGFTLASALERAKSQIKKLRNGGWELSRNDIGVVVMAQVVAEISRQSEGCETERYFEDIEDPIAQAIDNLYGCNSD